MANATLFILPIMGMVAVQRHGCGKMILCIESPCVFVFELVAPWLGASLKTHALGSVVSCRKHSF